MPSPFPGMDPYLENRLHWRGFHELFISAMTSALNATLPEGFAANVDERLYISWEQRPIYPDVAVIHHIPEAPPRASGGASVLELPDLQEDGAIEMNLLEFQERESYIEVLQLEASGLEERVVAIIEVLSPANEISSEGRDEYRRKQRATLRTSVSLLEIDLLREGSHMTAVPFSALLAPNGMDRDWNYLISLRLSEPTRRFRVWPRSVREPLPQITLPLSAAAPAGVSLNLQAAYDRAYDAGPYRRRVDYSRAPVPPLAAADAQWADGLLRGIGLRAD